MGMLPSRRRKLLDCLAEALYGSSNDFCTKDDARATVEEILDDFEELNEETRSVELDPEPPRGRGAAKGP